MKKETLDNDSKLTLDPNRKCYGSNLTETEYSSLAEANVNVDMKEAFNLSGKTFTKISLAEQHEHCICEGSYCNGVSWDRLSPLFVAVTLLLGIMMRTVDL